MKKAKQETTARRKAGPEATKLSKRLQPEADADREAVLDEREKLQRLFPPAYSPDIGVWSGDKVEVMLRLTYAQSVNLAHLLNENKL